MDDQQRARELLALGLDEYGHHAEAANVREGIDLDVYRIELWSITAALRAAPEWQPMDSAPKDGTVVLVMIDGSDIPQPCRFRERVGWVIAWDEWRIPAHDGPLGWMPLPAARPPAGGEGSPANRRMHGVELQTVPSAPKPPRSHGACRHRLATGQPAGRER